MGEFDELLGKLQVIPEAARYEQLAEESAELAKAALKMSRILRGENPTPVKKDEAAEMIREEISDVFSAAAVLNIDPDIDIMMMKLRRWAGRLEPDKR